MYRFPIINVAHFTPTLLISGAQLEILQGRGQNQKKGTLLIISPESQFSNSETEGRNQGIFLLHLLL